MNNPKYIMNNAWYYVYYEQRTILSILRTMHGTTYTTNKEQYYLYYEQCTVLCILRTMNNTIYILRTMHGNLLRVMYSIVLYCPIPCTIYIAVQIYILS